MQSLASTLRQVKRVLLRNIEGPQTIKDCFVRTHGRLPDTVQPQLFSDKLYQQMQNTHRLGDAVQTRLSDKILARDFVRETAGPDFLTELIWTGDTAQAIPFADLPAISIAKTNHGSGGNIVLRRPFDPATVVAELETWRRSNFYWQNREAQYRPIKPRILIEEFLEDGQPDGPLDYRFWCFKGRPEMIQVDNHSHSINPFYDLNWNRISLSYRKEFKDIEIKRPGNLDAMIDLASRLSAAFSFVRVDLYSLPNRVVFGEMTFTPVAGRFQWSPKEWDARLGSKWM